FTLLEWYRPGFDLTDLMAEVAELVKAVCGVPVTERLTYRAAFQRYTGLDPFFTDDVTLSDYARSLSGLSTSFTKDDALDVILSHEIEPKLGAEGGTFIYHYPPSQAALARTCEDDGVQVAQRFELYIRGIEIANGYYE